MRKPLIEISQPSLTERKVQHTYGKKGGVGLRTIKTGYNIFATEQDIENKFRNLDLENKGPAKRESLSETPLPPFAVAKDSKSLSRCISNQNKSLDRLNLPNPDPQTTAISLSGKSKVHQFDSHDKKPSKRPRLNGQDEADLRCLVCLGGNSDIETFEAVAEKIDTHCEIEKIGEGSYSCVFAVRVRGTASSPAAAEASIMKVIPLRLSSQPTSADGTTCQDVISEVQISEALNEVHGFLEFRGVKVVYGEWPDSFLSAFRYFKKHQRKRAENPDPAETYSSDQYYAILEMSDAGHEFSTHIRRPSAFQMYDIFWMITIHLAMAENQVRFEHRDLHISNICVKSAQSCGRLDVDSKLVQEMESDPVIKLGLSSLRVAIIDYTLSRVERENGDVSYSPPDDEDNDVEEVTETEKHEDMLQRITYYKQSAYLACIQKESMRDATAKQSEIFNEKDKWRLYAPQTNIHWLAYLLQVLLHRTGKQQKTMYIARSNDIAKKVQDQIRASLKEVDTHINHAEYNSLPNSAEELLEIAVKRGWLSQQEITSFQQRLE